MKPALAILVFVVLEVTLCRLLVSAWHEERDHAAFLYDCTHHQTPPACENVWLAQYASQPPPIVIQLAGNP